MRCLAGPHVLRVEAPVQLLLVERRLDLQAAPQVTVSQRGQFFAPIRVQTHFQGGAANAHYH